MEDDAPKAHGDEPAGLDVPKAQETAPAPRKKPGAWRWWLFALLPVLPVAIGVAIVFSPGWIEGYVLRQLEQSDLDEKELTLEKVTWNYLSAKDLRFADRDTGWEASARKLEVNYNPFGLLSGRVHLANVSGLTVMVDLDQWDASRTAQDEEAGEQPPFGFSGDRGPLRTLAHLLPLDLLTLEDSQVHLKRAQALQKLSLEGTLSPQGRNELRVEGEGVTDLIVELSGLMQARQGEADLELEFQSAAFTPLLRFVDPANRLLGGDRVEVDLGQTSIFGRLRFIDDHPLFVPERGDLRLARYRDGAFVIESVQAEFTAGAEAGWVDFTLAPFDLRFPPVSLDASVTASGRYRPGASLAESALEATVRADRASVLGVETQPFEFPVEGTLASMTASQPEILEKDGQTLCLAETRVELNGLDSTHQTLRAEAGLGVALPGFTTPEPAAVGLEEAVLLPLAVNWERKEGRQRMELSLRAGSAGAPLRHTWNDVDIQTVAAMSLDLITENVRTTGTWNFELDRIQLDREGQEITALQDLRLEGDVAPDRFTVSGGGVFDGKRFPVSADIALPVDEAAPTEGVFEAGPVVQREVTWPGRVYRPLRGVQLSGDIALAGTTLLTPREPSQIAGEVKLAKGKMLYPGDAIRVLQASVDLNLPELPATTLGRSTLTAQRVETKEDVTLESPRIVLETAPGNGLRIHQASATLFGGRLSTASPFVISQDRRNFDCVIDIRGLQAGRLVALIPNFDGSIDARLDGRVPVKVVDGRISFQTGWLRLTPNTNATLRYNAEGLLTRDVEKRRQRRIYEKVEKALGNLRIESLEVRLFDPADAGSPVSLRLEGRSIDRQFDIPVNLNLNVEDAESFIKGGVQWFAERILNL